MPHRRELLEHLDVGRWSCFGSLQHRQFEFFEQHGPQLRGRSEVELASGGAINVHLETGQLLVESAGHLTKEGAIDEHARRFHVDEHGNERDFDLVQEAGQMMVFDLRAKCFCQPQHHLRVRSGNTPRLGGRHRGKLAVLADQLRRRGQLDGKTLAREIRDGMRPVAGIEHEARDHGVVGDAAEGYTGARERDPSGLDVVSRFFHCGIREQRPEVRHRSARERKGRRGAADRPELSHHAVHDAARRTAAEQVRERRVARGLALERGAVDRGGGCFRAQQIRRSDLHAGGAELQRCSDRARIGDAARGDDGNLDCVDDLRHQGQRPDLCRQVVGQEHATMSARFESLRDDGVDAARIEPPCLFNRGCRGKNLRAERAYACELVVGRQSEMEADDGRSEFA